MNSNFSFKFGAHPILLEPPGSLLAGNDISALLTSSFGNIRQNSAFRVSGVLQLAKSDPPVTKNFPLLSLFPLSFQDG